MADKANPNGLNGANEYSAQRLNLHRPDASTIAEPGGYYGGSGGNRVDRADINKTKDRVSSQKTDVFPGGTSSGSSY